MDIYKKTAEILLDKYKLSTKFINILAEERGFSNLLEIVDENLSIKQKLELMLKIEEAEFFAGNNSRIRELRKKIIDCWDESSRDEQFELRCHNKGKSNFHRATKLSELNWHMGGLWPKVFMSISGIDSFFAGYKNESLKYEDFEDIEPYKCLPQLKDYQISLKNDLMKILKEKGDDAKCMISLPTGSGKTRIAVEAYTEFLRPRFFEGKYLIWIAQSEELCEQAIATFHQIWQHKEFTETLRIYRFYGKHDLHEKNMMGGIVVCCINKLYNAIDNNKPEIKNLIEECGACIIDEAHRAVISMYELFYKRSQSIRGQKMFPICGLTATPGRNDDISKLTNFFVFNLITPTPYIPKEYENNPIEYFREMGYLARPVHEIIQTGETIIIDFKDEHNKPSLDQLQFEVEKKTNRDLTSNSKRNKKILEKLLSIKNGQVIVYACNVEHAKLITYALILNGIKAAAITAETSRYKRQLYVEQFRKNEIQILVNHSVLTTGFDAPKTNYIVICRPIFSDILYEQIVGRGLRGPKFGGTEKCKIIDFTDNLGRFGDQQSYNRFKDFWSYEEN